MLKNCKFCINNDKGGDKMVFQLKIMLKGSKPPIWRRLEVRDTMTFYELHQAIQIAFEWYDSHLHGFDIRKTNGISVNEYNSIGPKNEEYGFFDFEQDEKAVLLGDIFRKEQDKVIYTYDFGDNWEHEIVLEKIIPEEEDTFYPRCTKVMREAPEEDSRFKYLDNFTTEDVDGIEYMEDINEELMDVFADQMETRQIHNWSTLLDAVDEFKALQPWKWLDDDQIFAVEDPETDDFIFCSILGSGGMEYGLAAYIGSDGMHFLQNLLSGKNIDHSLYIQQRCILLSFSNREDLSKEDYQLLKDYGRTYRGKNQWPQFRSFIPGFHPWKLDDDEVRRFSKWMEEILYICNLTKENPDLVESFNGTHVFASLFDDQANEWFNGFITIQKNNRFEENIPILVNELEMQVLKKLKTRLNMSLEFECDYFFSPVQNSPNERPYYPRLAIALERENGLIVYNDMLNMSNDIAAAQRGLANLMMRLNGIPKELIVREDIVTYIRPLAEKFKIKLIAVKSLPIIKKVLKEMEMMFPH
jgi:hypothetical protein